MMTLIEHIRAENAKTAAWLAEGPNRWAGMITEDLAHWADIGITTVEQYELYMAQSTFSDMYKDAYGFRPRFDTSDWSLEKWQQAIDSVSADLAASIDREEAEAAAAVEELEAEIAKVISLGAGDRTTALRWMTQGERFYSSQCVEGWVYDRGVLFTDYGRKLVIELTNIVTLEEMEDA